MNRNTTLLSSAFREVFKNPLSVALACVTSAAVLLLFILMPNLQFIWWVAGSDILSNGAKMNLLFNAVNIWSSSVPLISQTLFILIALITGVNVSFLVYYLRKRLKNYATSGMSAVGLIVGMLGIGCSSCGSVLLTLFLGVTATAGVLAFLPFRGLEFSLFSLLLMGISLAMMARQIVMSPSCDYKKPSRFSAFIRGVLKKRP